MLELMLRLNILLFDVSWEWGTHSKGLDMSQVFHNARARRAVPAAMWAVLSGRACPWLVVQSILRHRTHTLSVSVSVSTFVGHW